MTMRITMIQSRLGESGSVLVAGTTYTVSDPFGAAMVGAGYATDTDRALTPGVSEYTPSTAASVQSLVSGAGNQLANGKPQQSAIGSRKITSLGGRVLVGGQDYRGTFINAHDQFIDFLTTATITGVTQANPGVITTGAAHGLNVNDPVTINGIVGMTQLSGNYLVNTTPTTTTLTVKDAVSGVPVNTSAFTAWSSGGTIQRNWHRLDLPAIAASGVRFVRVSMGPLTQAAWTSQIGTSGTAPVATFLANLRTFMDSAASAGLGVILVLFWKHDIIPLALTSTQSDYLTPGSTTRAYMKALASTVALNFYRHPALAAWQIGNEWFDFASVAKFATAGNTTNTGLDHFGALVGTTNDIVDGIRVWDNDTSILSPSGTNGRYEAGNSPTFVRKFIAAAGKCDLIDHHLYPDTDRSGFAHVGSGLDMGGADIFLPMLRNAALQVGKAIIVTEVAGDDDNSAFGSSAMGALSLTSWTKAHAAGIELVGDWGWYADTNLYSTSLPNLKLLRNSVMARIAPYNATLTAGFVPPSPPLPALGSFPVPSVCARGSGAANSFVRIPINADLSHDTVATARLVIMFWMRKRAVLGASPRLFANNDGTQGYLLGSNAAEGLTFQQSFAGSYTQFTGSGQFFNYPADIPTDAAIGLPWEWQHVALSWDGTQNPGAWSDNSQHFTIYINGQVAYRVATTGKTASGTTTRDLYLLSGSDGLSGFAQADMFDFMIGKGFTLTNQMVSDYLRLGTVPAGIQHRWKLNGNTLDSIGTLHGVAGSALTYVTNGVGNQA